MPRKVMTIVGTRPELIKLCRVIHELDRQFDHVLVHTGQNFDYELNEVFFKDLGIRKPDHFLNAAGESPAETIANVISLGDKLLEREKPDALMLLGDTNSCLVVLAAKRRKIPIFHMEAGNRCFDLRVPEEINRKVVDHLSDINLTYTDHARRYLLAEGLRPETVIKTGSPMKEILDHYRPSIEGSRILGTLGLKADGYFIASIHREENVDDPANFAALLQSLQAIVERHHLPVVVSTHPRTRKRLDQMHPAPLAEGVQFLKPMGFFDYVHLQTRARCVLSDSGTITEEASILGFPAVTLRQTHERPEGMDEGTLVMSGVSKDRVLEAIDLVVAHHREGHRSRVVPDYDVADVSHKVVRIVASYIDYVNRVTWAKAGS